MKTRQMFRLEEERYYCLNTADTKGNKIDWQIYGQPASPANRILKISYKACNPVQSTGFANQTDSCQVDLTDPAEVKSKREKSIKYAE